jgi:pyridoxal 5'-phosphate synthase pdxS subunit
VPFVCGCRNLGEALRRIAEGAAMIRTKGEAGLGQHRRGGAAHAHGAVRHPPLQLLREDELMAEAKARRALVELVREVAKRSGKLPVPNFAAGGIATPADAALMMQLGAETVFVGSGIFKSRDPKPRAEAIVQAVTYHDDPARLLAISMELGEAMAGIDVATLPESEKMASRGW